LLVIIGNNEIYSIIKSLIFASLRCKDILRIPEKYQKYRYAKKTQLFLDLKKYRYVGDIQIKGRVSK